MSIKRNLFLCLLLAIAWPATTRAGLDAEFLLGDGALRKPVPTQAYTPTGGSFPKNHFEGELILGPASGRIRMKVSRDWFGYARNDDLQVKRFPAMSIEIVQDGNRLLPLDRTPRAGDHPHWELSLGPGQAWDDPKDGGWSRAAFPFALLERNANCTHNGLMTFLYRGDGSISRVAFQVGMETCQYFQADIWGMLSARYKPRSLADARQAVEGYRTEQASRLPVRPLSVLESVYPGVKAGQFDWYPANEVTTLGFVIDGVHYSGGCETRHGPYPFCDELVLPSYSLAKSVFGGLALMMLEQERPGIGRTLVSDYVPECSGAVWKGVTLEHLLDMTTGNYNSLEADADEFALYETPFMSGETHTRKVTTACRLFSRRDWPGRTFAYHSSDSYLAGTVMNELLAGEPGSEADVHRDLLYARLFAPLGLSGLTGFTRRTYDEKAQPFTGYGLYFLADDIARIGQFLYFGDGKVGGDQVVDSYLLKSALQRNPSDTGVPAGSEELRYNSGFWAYRANVGGCEEPVWLPFMSGYGGISVAIFPNRSLFYIFSDMGRFEWLRAAIESNSIRSFCN